MLYDLPLPARGARILVADDSTINRDLLKLLLESRGAHVETARNGYEVLRAFEAGSFDLILMDCRMPGLDGFATTRRIRQQEYRTGRAHTPVIAVTAYAPPGYRAHCQRAGMDDLLTKPLHREELDEVLHHWLPVALPVAA